jgi:hypothetical protein
MHEWDRAQASLRSIKPQDLGMRTSPWAQTGLRLNTISEAREGVRLWAEQTVHNSTPASLAGRYINPYTAKTRATEPGEVEILGNDGAVRAVV